MDLVEQLVFAMEVQDNKLQLCVKKEISRKFLSAGMAQCTSHAIRALLKLKCKCLGLSWGIGDGIVGIETPGMSSSSQAHLSFSDCDQW